MSESTRIDAIRVVDRHRKDFRDLDSLAASIKELGVLAPVLIDPDLRLIDGERRVRAAKSLGMETIPTRIVSNLTEATDLLKAERDANLCRQEMTVSEKVSLARRIEELERPKALERMSERGKAGAESRWGGGGSTEPTPSAPRRSSDTAAEAAGLSRATYERAKKVMDAATNPEEEPEVQAAAKEAVAAMDRGGSVRAALRSVDEAKGKAASPERPALALPQPAKYGPRKKHVQIIDSMAVTLRGLAMAAEGIGELDATVTAEEAARLKGDLSKSLSALNTLKKNLERKATS